MCNWVNPNPLTQARHNKAKHTKGKNVFIKNSTPKTNQG
jgi:hypothetical protein